VIRQGVMKSFGGRVIWECVLGFWVISSRNFRFLGSGIFEVYFSVIENWIMNFSQVWRYLIEFLFLFKLRHLIFNVFKILCRMRCKQTNFK